MTDGFEACFAQADKLVVADCRDGLVYRSGHGDDENLAGFEVGRVAAEAEMCGLREFF